MLPATLLPSPAPAPAAGVVAAHPAIDVVVPVYNEQRVLAGSIRRLHDYLARRLPVLVAHHDRRQREHRRAPRDVARRAGRATLPRRRGARPRPRRAAAARCARPGRRSDADVVAYMDVDLSTDLDALLPLVAPLVSGHSDVAIGTRLARGARVVRGAQARADLARLQPRCCTRRCGARFSDAQCGFKAMRADVARAAAARRCATTAGSSTPSCWCSPSARACASTRCRSTGSTTPTRASTSCAPRVDDLRGIVRLLAGARLTRFLAVGVVLDAGLRAALRPAARAARPRTGATRSRWR